MYGDPSESYDNEGFECTPRAIHLLTGRNRDGDNLHETSDLLESDEPSPYDGSEDDSKDEDGDDVADMFDAAASPHAKKTTPSERMSYTVPTRTMSGFNNATSGSPIAMSKMTTQSRSASTSRLSSEDRSPKLV